MLTIRIAGGRVLARDVRTERWGGLFGLMFRKKIGDEEALLFRIGGDGRYPVHTFFLRFPLDLVFTDSRMRVVEIRAHLAPWGLYVPRCRAAFLIELPAGKVAVSGLRVGDRLLLEKVISGKRQR